MSNDAVIVFKINIPFIIEYMSDNVDLIINLIVIGEANVGKTNIVQRYIKNEFIENSLPTIGLDY